MSNMRAKVKLTSITSLEYGDELEFDAVYTNNKEDNSYSSATPLAQFKMQVNNPDLVGTFKAGASYYVDFTKIDPSPAT